MTFWWHHRDHLPTGVSLQASDETSLHSSVSFYPLEGGSFIWKRQQSSVHCATQINTLQDSAGLSFSFLKSISQEIEKTISMSKSRGTWRGSDHLASSIRLHHQSSTHLAFGFLDSSIGQRREAQKVHVNQFCSVAKHESFAVFVLSRCQHL